jgi:hypothetical protein
VKALDVPIMFLAPYSYLSAPCELVFGQFKNKNINIASLPMGKKVTYPLKILSFRIFTM